MNADLFYRSWNGHTKTKSVKETSVEVGEEMGFAEILAAATEQTGVQFARRGGLGVFQIQTDAGIWARTDGTEGVLQAHNVTFKSWEQLEAEELAA